MGSGAEGLLHRMTLTVAVAMPQAIRVMSAERVTQRPGPLGTATATRPPSTARAVEAARPGAPASQSHPRRPRRRRVHRRPPTRLLRPRRPTRPSMVVEVVGQSAASPTPAQRTSAAAATRPRGRSRVTIATNPRPTVIDATRMPLGVVVMSPRLRQHRRLHRYQRQLQRRRHIRRHRLRRRRRRRPPPRSAGRLQAPLPQRPLLLGPPRPPLPGRPRRCPSTPRGPRARGRRATGTAASRAAPGQGRARWTSPRYRAMLPLERG